MRATGYTQIAVSLLMAGTLSAANRPAAGMNQFAADLYQKLARANQENLIFSPFNIGAALSMLLQGASGGTASEIASVLHQPYPDPDYIAALASLTKELIDEANGNGNELSAANAVWLERGFRIRSDYRDKIQALLQGSMGQLSFLDNPEQARSEINSWTERRTKGRITELFPRGAIDANTRLVVTAAIYFYGKWQSAFHPGRTHPAPFQAAGGGAVQTPFMNQTGRFGYAETGAAQILEMKYRANPLVFDVLLPKSRDGLGALEQEMTADNLAAWLKPVESRTVEVSMPKFRAESQFSLRNALSKLGMGAAFTGAADFSGIDDRRDLKLSDVLHKAFVDVAEEGTEAAAATGSAVTMVAMVAAPRIVFRADHPFAFVIRDARTGVILFAGRLTHPA
jgi:serpin B